MLAGVDPKYFLDEMQDYEVTALLKAVADKENADTLKQRFFTAHLLAPHAKAGATLDKLIPLPSDKTEPTKDEINRLKELVKQRNNGGFSQ